MSMSMLSKLEAKKYDLVFDLVCDWLNVAPANHKPGDFSAHSIVLKRENKLKVILGIILNVG